jgi:hypothetical protein
VSLIASGIRWGGDLIAQASTHAFGLHEVEQAIHTLAGDVPGADAIGVSVEPGRA